MLRVIGSAFAILVAASMTSQAQEVRLTAETASRTITLKDKQITIARSQAEDARLEGDFARTSRPCPPHCLTPMAAAPGVETVGELELIGFLEASVATERGLLLDARVPTGFAKGTIPGAVNVPHTTLNDDNPFRAEILKAFGAKADGDVLDFSAAKELLVFADGPWSGDAAAAIRSLRGAGYPAEKLSYYRGGMQVWMILGLTVKTP